MLRVRCRLQPILAPVLDPVMKVMDDLIDKIEKQLSSAIPDPPA